MSKSSSTSNKAFLLAFAMIVSVPSAALAWDSDSNPDSVLTVSVDMGSNDAGDGDGESGCTGFASMELSASVLQSRPERVQPAIANPTLPQRLAAVASYRWAVPPINGAFEDVSYFTRSADVTGSWTVNSAWVASVVGGNQNQDLKAVLEELIQTDLTGYTNAPLTISAETPSLAMIDRRTYVTSPFTFSYDASSCVSDSRAEAEIFIQRTNLEVRTDNGWDSVELDWESNNPYNATELLRISTDGGFRGEAHLLRSRTLSDGDRRINDVASSPGFCPCDPVFSGDSGVNSMRAVTKLYGELSQNAQLRTQYGFWMDVDPYDD